MDEAYDDTGNMIPKDSFAILIARDGECTLAVPKMGGKELMPNAWLAATMVGIKFMKDPEWVQEMIDEFENAKKRRN